MKMCFTRSVNISYVILCCMKKRSFKGAVRAEDIYYLSKDVGRFLKPNNQTSGNYIAKVVEDEMNNNLTKGVVPDHLFGSISELIAEKLINKIIHKKRLHTKDKK